MNGENEWLIWHDDGETPQVHLLIVQAETMAEALKKSGPVAESVWFCLLRTEQGVAKGLLAGLSDALLDRLAKDGPAELG